MKLYNVSGFKLCLFLLPLKFVAADIRFKLACFPNKNTLNAFPVVFQSGFGDICLILSTLSVKQTNEKAC